MFNRETTRTGRAMSGLINLFKIQDAPEYLEMSKEDAKIMSENHIAQLAQELKDTLEYKSNPDPESEFLLKYEFDKKYNISMMQINLQNDKRLQLLLKLMGISFEDKSDFYFYCLRLNRRFQEGMQLKVVETLMKRNAAAKIQSALEMPVEQLKGCPFTPGEIVQSGMFGLRKVVRTQGDSVILCNPQTEEGLIEVPSSRLIKLNPEYYALMHSENKKSSFLTLIKE